ncbi:Glycolipid anchored surface protein 4 precursor [Savitreella phatthalungensis]
MLSLVFTTLLGAADALNPVVVRNNVFYTTGTGERFFPIGVDYQPGGASGVTKGSDPLSDIDICRRDVFLFQKLGANTVRIYSVDNAVNHDECMSLYNAAGIYLMLDVNSPLEGQHLNRDEPWTTYNHIYAEHVFRTIEAFGPYPNLLGFFSGNELINSDKSAITSPPYIKAITRDMKDYIRKYMDRPIPVGYSAADDLNYRMETAQYMSCGDDSVGLNDFYAINSYQWCGQQTLQSSGYDTLLQSFSNFSLPLFFSEYGCNEVRPRGFSEVPAIYSSPMTDVFSGGLVYEYTQEPNNYGLVEVDDDETAKMRADYVSLASRFKNVTAASLPRAIPSAQAKAPTCPPESSYQHLNGSRTVPRLAEIQKLIDSRITSNVVKGSLQTSVSLDQTKYNIKDQNGNSISNKQITRATSSGTVGDLKTLFSNNPNSATGTATARAGNTSGAASTAARAQAQASSAASSLVLRTAGGKALAVAALCAFVGFTVL